MTTTTAEVKPDIETILARYPDAGRDALIPLLQEVQETYGYLSREAIQEVGRHLKLPTSKIFGVATFYNQFRFQPMGKYHIQICRGTACHVKGSAAVLDVLQQELNLSAGQTSRDGLFSLEVVACIGACGLAPVMSINGVFYAGLTPAKTRQIIEKYRKGGPES
ncbi:MAG TPA: NADH-quinone oxidoreductase subunit NuoE [Candidatus Hydrogenedentes bacterium]|nr:NADH-quinone oxidoreductase subunit NuoE [Candidatus Hydrogenedentota bacterium]HOV74849.1 NADH-quinone oxidoreductase subunit NuoE [Candidatus Hydrogenedentota bacterium]